MAVVRVRAQDGPGISGRCRTLPQQRTVLRSRCSIQEESNERGRVGCYLLSSVMASGVGNQHQHTHEPATATLPTFSRRHGNLQQPSNCGCCIDREQMSATRVPKRGIPTLLSCYSGGLQ